MLAETLALLTSLLLTVVSLRVYISIAERRKWVALDAHKTEKRYVADRGGIVLFLIPVMAMPLLLVGDQRIYASLCLAVISGCIVGLVDDFRDLGLKKAIIVAIAGLPIVLLRTYNPRPYIPLIGGTRMTIVYVLFIFVLFSIMADACNMIDIFNGVLVVQGLAILIPLAILSLLSGSELGILLSLVGIGYSIGFLAWNRYPARVFHGNVGAYGYGALLAAIVILSGTQVRGVEFVSIVAFLPSIFNGFIFVFNARFATRAKISLEEKPVLFRDGYLYANPNEAAHMDLTRLLLLPGKLTEKNLIVIYYTMFSISCILAVITGLLMSAGFI